MVVFILCNIFIHEKHHINTRNKKILHKFPLKLSMLHNSPYNMAVKVPYYQAKLKIK